MAVRAVLGQSFQVQRYFLVALPQGVDHILAGPSCVCNSWKLSHDRAGSTRSTNSTKKA